MSAPSQILPLKVRGSVLGFLNTLGLGVAFFTMQYYLYLVDTIGNSMVMAIMGLWCLFALLFNCFFVPEFENKTYSEIVYALNHKLPRRFRLIPDREQSLDYS
uniref:Major facilitator superfamily (MFS) profile domain-containing protein n=1 Tax=Lutzomyia longipalpis TaxID=7200 RepID=A0A7G3B389_LUTLO